MREFSCLEQAPKAFDWQREVGLWQGFLQKAESFLVTAQFEIINPS